jgi:ATP-dependent Clp protease adaptor protein ClpS
MKAADKILAEKDSDKEKDIHHDVGVGVQEALPRVAEPPKFAVLLHNDDYTTMEFVLDILTNDFSKSSDEAMGLMLRVHHEGKAVAGIYSFEIAEAKVSKVTEKSRQSGFPLKLTLERSQS